MLYGILDTLPEGAFDEISRLACQICGTPLGNISFVDEQRVWLKSCVGMSTREVPRQFAFCAHAIMQGDLFVVEDASRNELFQDFPMVTGEPHVQFYAGAPLSTPDGHRLGALAVLDTRPRQLSHEQQEALRILARQVATQLELRRHLVSLARSVEEHKRTEGQLRNSEAFYHALVETLPQNILRKDAQGRFTFVNRKFCQSLGKRMDEIIGKTDYAFFPPELAAKYHQDDLRVMNTLES